MLSKKDAALYYKLRDELFMFAMDVFFKKELQKIQNKTDDFQIIMNYFANKIFDKNNRYILDALVRMNPNKLPQEELDIIGGWRNFIKGQFFFFEQRNNYAVFLSLQNDERGIYGVKGITESVEDVCCKGNFKIPVVLDTILLPFKEIIIYHGLLSFGEQLAEPTRINLQKQISEIIASKSIITSLNFVSENKKIRNQLVCQ